MASNELLLPVNYSGFNSNRKEPKKLIPDYCSAQSVQS